jgi:hypothetical protein
LNAHLATPDEELDYDADSRLALMAQAKLVLHSLNAANSTDRRFRDEANHALWELSTKVLKDIQRKRSRKQNAQNKAPATAHLPTISDEQLDDDADWNSRLMADSQLLMDALNAYGEADRSKFRDEVRHELSEASTAVFADIKRKKDRKW